MTNMNQVALQQKQTNKQDTRSTAVTGKVLGEESHLAQDPELTAEQQLESEQQSAQGIEPEQQYRAGFYSLLAALLRHAPDQAMLDEVSALATVSEQTPESKSELTVAMSMLGLAASTSKPSAVDDEYHDLFIGLGRGELVPYGSWYQTGYLMEKPLRYLRDDLARLGYQREEGVYEPEDHVAALCEVMMFMISDGLAVERQAQFYNAHLAEWIERFFSDLSQAKAAVFYRAVGRLGQAFTEIEKRYLSMQV